MHLIYTTGEHFQTSAFEKDSVFTRSAYAGCGGFTDIFKQTTEFQNNGVSIGAVVVEAQNKLGGSNTEGNSKRSLLRAFGRGFFVVARVVMVWLAGK